MQGEGLAWLFLPWIFGAVASSSRKTFVSREPRAFQGVKAKDFQAQVLAVFHRHRGGQINATIPHNRRRPAFAGNRLLPDDVFRRAPFDGKPFAGIYALTGGAAKVRPILATAGKAQPNERSIANGKVRSRMRVLMKVFAGGSTQ